MSPNVVVDWLAKNDAYAKAIVQMAGIRVGSCNAGVPIRIEALWDEGFKGPIVYSIPLAEGTLFWSGETTHTALFRKTLGLLTDTFKGLMLPTRVVVFDGEIDLTAKKLHFKSFTFGQTHVVPTSNLIVLSHTVDKIDKMQEILQKFVILSRKLKGIGMS